MMLDNLIIPDEIEELLERYAEAVLVYREYACAETGEELDTAKLGLLLQMGIC